MKKNPYAVASLTVGVISFIQLFGVEKALVAGIFGLIALAQIKKDTVPEQDLSLRKSDKTMAVIGIALAALYILAVGFLFYFKSGEIINAIHRFK